MPILNEYNNLEELIKAITHNQVDIENLLDWESERKLSKWLEEKGEVDKARRLTEEYDIQIENPSLILAVLSFSKEEIEKITGKSINYDNHQSEILSLEELNREVNRLKKQIHGLNSLRMPIGTIALFPTDNIPLGWLKCEGQCLSALYFEDLFARLEYTWGSNGKNYFFLPNLCQQACNTGLCYCILTGGYQDLPVEAVKPLLQFTINGVTFEMVFVEGGKFMMGSENCNNEKPIHQVTLTSYYIGQFQVTQALWNTIMPNNPSRFKGDTLPVESVSYDDCNIFIEKLNEITGKHFRLPTEAEWEFAARGGTKSKGYKYSGSNNIEEIAWYGETYTIGKTHPVGKKKPNELGIYDMNGNVWEWCKDWFGSYLSINQTNPIGPNIGSYREYRGGCWYSFPYECSPTHRSTNYSVGLSYLHIGLRLVLLP